MNESDIELLLTLQKTHNITKTAEYMHLTQPALTRRIQILEEDLGTKILIRSRNGAFFTPIGDAILPHIHAVRKDLDAIRDYTNRKAGHIRGDIKMAVSINYAQFGMAETVARFTKTFPEVSLHIESEQSRAIYQRLLMNEISLAVLRGKYQWENIRICFQKEPVYVIYTREVSLEELNTIHYIDRHMEHDLAESIQRWMRQNSLSPHHQIYIDNINAAVSMVKNGLGWAIIPGACIRDFDGFRMPVNLQDTPLTRDTYLITRNEYLALPEVWLLCNTILSCGNVPEAVKKLPMPKEIKEMNIEALLPDFDEMSKA